MAFVRRAEDRAAELENADGVLWFEHRIITGWQESFEAVAETDDLPAELGRRADNAVDDRIEPGTIATAVQDSDSHGGGFLMEKRAA